MSDDLARRVERLGAIEAMRAAFNRFVDLLDLGAIDDLLGVFTANVLVEVMNCPPGSGHDLEFRGRDAVRALHGPLWAPPAPR